MAISSEVYRDKLKKCIIQNQSNLDEVLAEHHFGQGIVKPTAQQAQINDFTDANMRSAIHAFETGMAHYKEVYDRI